MNANETEALRRRVSALTQSYQDARDTVALREKDIRRGVERAERAERQRDELGLQLVAAQTEIGRMRKVVDAARLYVDTNHGDIEHLYGALARALKALDVVPGDALSASASASASKDGEA